MSSTIQFACRLTQQADGTWHVRHDGPDVGSVSVTAASRDAALAKMSNELRYRLELCPCSGERYREIRIEIIEQPEQPTIAGRGR